MMRCRYPFAVALCLALTTTVVITSTTACNPNDPSACIKSPTDPRPEPQLYINIERLWKKPAIPVCWESSTWALHPDSDRALVKQAVEQTWGAALNFEFIPESNRFHFTGWDQCTDSTDTGIRIQVPLNSPKNPHTKSLGTAIAGAKNGMVLNFDFKKWSTSCSRSEHARKRCLTTIAVHEFGHALGFAHEQNRPDTNRAHCKDAPQGTSGDLLVGPWDSHSVMNYCNPVWNNGGALSAGDILGTRAVYYPELYDFTCVGKYKERDPQYKAALECKDFAACTGVPAQYCTRTLPDGVCKSSYYEIQGETVDCGETCATPGSDEPSECETIARLAIAATCEAP